MRVSQHLAVQQAGLQVTGNNIAKAGNADYSRQVAETTPALDQQIQTGIFLGTGVDLSSVSRQVDDALNSRLRSSISDSSAAATSSQWLGQVQSTLNALSGQDLASQMDTFFNDWSDLANNPTDNGQRQVVLQQGEPRRTICNGLQGQLAAFQTNVNQELTQPGGLRQWIGAAGCHVESSDRRDRRLERPARPTGFAISATRC